MVRTSLLLQLLLFALEVEEQRRSCYYKQRSRFGSEDLPHCV